MRNRRTFLRRPSRTYKYIIAVLADDGFVVYTSTVTAIFSKTVRRPGKYYYAFVCSTQLINVRVM
jgi:hypothetical protein